LLTATIQHVKKNRDPRWGESFQFMLEEPPTNERLYVEVQSASSKLGLLHPKVNLLSSQSDASLTQLMTLG